MIDTSEYKRISGHTWHVMKHHTPWGPEWFMLDAQNHAYGSRPVPLNWRDKYREGLEGCIITFHLTDGRWDDDVAREAEANQRLIMNAPLLLAEVERLRKLEDVVREAFSEDSKYASGEYMNIMGEILGVIKR